MSSGAPVLVGNPLARRIPYGPRESAALDPALAATARADLRKWPGYKETPLYSLPGLAARLGVRSVVAKYEGARTELGSFKALGGAYALSVLLSRIVESAVATPVTFTDLEGGAHSGVTSRITATCASDGNHGRSLAWGARRLGCKCVIYLPKAVSRFRADAIRGYGAEVVIVDGNYDDAVRMAARHADERGWLLVADTATPSYLEAPQLVNAGYSLLMDEAWRQIPAGEHPTHIFAQVGCGGLAAVVSSYVWSSLQDRRPMIIGVEPTNAACLLETVKAGKPAVVGGEHATVMGGLACGEVSSIAWEVLRHGLDFVIAIPDSSAIAAVLGLARGEFGAGLDAGESGAAGVGALLAIADDRGMQDQLALDADSRIMAIITEGPTDPEQFSAILSGRRS